MGRNENYDIQSWSQLHELMKDKTIYCDQEGEHKVMKMLNETEHIYFKIDIELFTIRACMLGYTSVLLDMIKRGADLHMIYEEHKSKNSLMHEAAHWGQSKIVTFLAKRGVPIESFNSNGWTPFHLAAKCGQKEACIALIKAGVNVNLKTNEGKWGKTALDLSRGYEPGRFILALEEAYKGTDLVICDDLKDGQKEILQRLLKYNQEVIDATLLVETADNELDENVLGNLQNRLTELGKTQKARREERKLRVQRHAQKEAENKRRLKVKKAQRKKKEKSLAEERKVFLKDFKSGVSMQFKDESERKYWADSRKKNGKNGWYYEYIFEVAERLAFLLQNAYVWDAKSVDYYFSVADDEGMSGSQAGMSKGFLTQAWLYQDRLKEVLGY